MDIRVAPVVIAAICATASCGRPQPPRVASTHFIVRCNAITNCRQQAVYNCGPTYRIVAAREPKSPVAQKLGSRKATEWTVACSDAHVGEPPAPDDIPAVAVTPSTAPTPDRPETGATTPPPTDISPVLDDFLAVEFFSVSGTFEVFDATGVRVKQEADSTSWRKGGLRFARISRTEGVSVGNLGSGTVNVSETKSALTFTEASRDQAYFHVLTVSKRWEANLAAFPAVYVRTIEPNQLNRGHRLISTFAGYVRPLTSTAAEPASSGKASDFQCYTHAQYGNPERECGTYLILCEQVPCFSQPFAYCLKATRPSAAAAQTICLASAAECATWHASEARKGRAAEVCRKTDYAVYVDANVRGE